MIAQRVGIINRSENSVVRRMGVVKGGSTYKRFEKIANFFHLSIISISISFINLESVSLGVDFSETVENIRRFILIEVRHFC